MYATEEFAVNIMFNAGGLDANCKNLQIAKGRTTGFFRFNMGQMVAVKNP
jgi:hypothetical protein